MEKGRIAVPSLGSGGLDGQRSQHFGHCEAFTLVDVENGEIIGRVKDAMVAGNVYETLKNIVAIEDTVHDCWSGRFPAVLCDDVSVATKR